MNADFMCDAKIKQIMLCWMERGHLKNLALNHLNLPQITQTPNKHSWKLMQISSNLTTLTLAQVYIQSRLSLMQSSAWSLIVQSNPKYMYGYI